MPPAYRVLEVSTTTGTADLVLSGTLTGYQTFGDAGLDGQTTDYVVEALNADGSQQGTWEKGQGVYTDATKTLTRATVQASSAGGLKVTLPSGNKRVFVPPPQQGDKGDTGATGASGSANLVFNEVPGGTVNGSNADFTLASPPSPATALLLYLNGLLQRQGAGNDYTLSGSTITFNTAPASGDWLSATYQF